MKAVKVAGTKPELVVRQLVRALGCRYRTNVRTLPGTPDLVNRSKGWAVLVHGCFWHGHACRLGTLPKRNVSFWQQKIDANRSRDVRSVAALRGRGLRVLEIWQCELEQPQFIRRRLKRLLGTVLIYRKLARHPDTHRR